MAGERETEALTTESKTEAEPDNEAEELGEVGDEYLYEGIYGIDPNSYRYPY